MRMPMRPRSVVAASILLLLSAADAAAQTAEVPRFEAQPFIGTRFGGSFDVREDLPGGFRRLDLSLGSGVTWGGTFGVFLTRDVEVEFMLSRQESAVHAEARDLRRTRLFDAAVIQYHGNVLFHFLEPESKWRPYALFGLGATRFDPDDDDVSGLSRFSFGFGGGLKVNLNERIGVRVQGRVTPTYLTSSRRIFCDAFFGFCYVGEVAHYVTQGEFTAGVSFRF